VVGIDVSISTFVGNSIPVLGSLIAALDCWGDRILQVATNADDMIYLRRDTDKESCVVDWRDIGDRVSLRRGIIDNADTTS